MTESVVAQYIESYMPAVEQAYGADARKIP